MKYTTLIRKLVQASLEAKWQKEDIADRLKDRCVDGIDVIREMLMNSVCDPRFRMHVGAVPGWKALAHQRLENFAEKLAMIDGLTKERALMEMDNMLAQWFDYIISLAEERGREVKFVSYDKNNPKDIIRKALDEYVNGKPVEDEKGEQLIEWSGEETEDPLGYADAEDGDEHLKATDDENEKPTGEAGSDDENEETEEDTSGRSFSNMQRKAGDPNRPGETVSGYTRDVENRFLTSVPPSLIELAKRIGRSSERETLKGAFLTAAKSDIAGIMTGNDLSCVLPSELAMMGDAATENIFYKNYVTRNLQLFASASHGAQGKVHRDGPIILCVDTSSSMDGDPIIVAMAITFAVCIIAQRRKRKVIVIKYSDSHETFFLHDIGTQRQELQSFLSSVESGGNNEDKLFWWLFTELLPAQGEYQSGDVLCVSDFGWAPISMETMKLIQEEKEKKMIFYGLNIGNGIWDSLTSAEIDEQYVNDGFGCGGCNDVCDSLWEYRNGICKEVKKNDEQPPHRGRP